MRALVLLVCLLIPLASAVADVEATHTGVVKTKHFEIRYRPGSRAAASVDRVAAMTERDYATICMELDIRPAPGLVLYLFDDVKELHALTETSGHAGMSGGNASYVPYDNDQTRFHEMMHIVTVRLPKSGDEPRNRFFPDGIANGVIEYVHGVPVHAVAAFYKRRGELPSIEEMTTGNFYTWMRAHPGFNAYDVGGSWFRFLLDTYGAKRVKRYYTGTAPKKAFGLAMSAVEKKWHAFLDAYEIRPELELLLRKRAGEKVEFASYESGLLERLLGSPSDWTSLMDAELRPVAEGKWTKKGDAIQAVNADNTWEICELGSETYEDCVVRARVRTPAYCPIQIRLGEGNQAMLVNGVFLYRGPNPAGNSTTPVMDGNRRVTDFVLVRRGGQIHVWIDGALALTTSAAAGAAPVGIGIFKGEASFEDVKVRRL